MPAKVVIRGVVFAHVIAAEAEILALSLATLRRAEHTLGRAARKGARGRRRLFRRALDPLYPDTVEQTRIQIHAMTFMTADAVGQVPNVSTQAKAPPIGA